ncbi:glycosyltransferase family 2 protein [Pseudomonas tussilaginis]|uniref:glycosyltransferase family 2 protein n=1 Tax=Pseudomonas sp. 5 TaxID=1619949 RepID=UPI0009E26BE1|nr:glycosyltransferase family 2 protein [Pseudomonas sp. 5]
MDRSEVGLIIPALNEAASIGAVVNRAKNFGIVIVVNDGSTDATADVARDAGAIVVNHESNQGYDAALSSGFAKGATLGMKAFITLDADGQHDPDLVARFVKEISSGVDLVLGVRDRRPRLSEHLFALYSRWRFGVRDPLCGMKGYSAKLYQDIGFFDSYGSIGTQLALTSLRKGYKFSEVEFKVRDRLDSPRFGRLIRANLKIFRAMFKDILS